MISRRKFTRKRILDTGYPYLLIAPVMVFLFVALLYPMAEAFRVSFYWYGTLGSRYIGLQNYQRLFADPAFWQSFNVTCTYTVVVVVAELFIGLGLAILLNRELKGKSLMTTLILAPMVLTPIVAGFMWRFMYNPDFGIINYLLESLGLPTSLWSSSADTALLSAAIVDIWSVTPYPTILFLAGLQVIPPAQYEAAQIDGASRWNKFRHVTIPWLMPMIVLYLVVRTSDAFQIFDIIFSLTGGGPGGATRSLSIYTYIQGWRNLELGFASAASYVLVAFSLVFAFFYVRILRTRVEV